MSAIREQGRPALIVRPPEKNTLTRQVASLLTEEIVSGRLAPGTLLPREQALCEQLGVSRMVVRESLKMLAAFGLIEIRHGVGVFINPPEAWQVAEPLSLLLRAERESLMHWWQMRALLEVGVAKLAATSATQEDIDAIAKTLERMRAAANNEEMVAADLDFHLAIATATGNPLIVVMMRPIMRPVHDYLLSATHLPDRPAESIAEHEAIFQAIAAHDVARAVLLMESHLSGVAGEITALHSQRVP